MIFSVIYKHTEAVILRSNNKDSICVSPNCKKIEVNRMLCLPIDSQSPKSKPILNGYSMCFMVGVAVYWKRQYKFKKRCCAYSSMILNNKYYVMHNFLFAMIETSFKCCVSFEKSSKLWITKLITAKKKKTKRISSNNVQQHYFNCNVEV